jgi:putative intracellular protease/amidase
MSSTINRRQCEVAVILTNCGWIGHGSERGTNLASNNNNTERDVNRDSRRGRKTGWDVRDLAHVWKWLSEHGYKDRTFFASPNGGEAPMDPMSREEGEKHDEVVRKFLKEDWLWDTMKNTKRIQDLEMESVKLIILIGGHGAMHDFYNSMYLSKLISNLWSRKGWISAIAEGVIGLANARDEKGDWMIKNKRITCVSNQEEDKQNLTDDLPYMVEDKMKEAGAKLEIAEAFQEKVVTDENGIITAQNHQSAEWFAKTVINAFKSKPSPRQ